jgi:glycine/D-amino acid oxidase-like deaminating enzyme
MSEIERAETVIIGAGIVGLSIAWQLQRRGQRGIHVLERATGVGAGSTGASSAVCRHRYSRDEMVRLARCGIDAYRNWPEFTGLTAPRARLHNDGVLWFSGEDDRWVDGERERLAALAVRAEILDSDDIRQRFPAFNPCSAIPDPDAPGLVSSGAETRHLFEPDGGYVDPVDAAQDLAEACRGAGIQLHFGADVTEVNLEGGRVAGVGLADGRRFACERLVNAAGPWCSRVFDAVGVAMPMPMAAMRIQVLYLERNAEVRGPLPVCADLGAGIYFRGQNRGQQIVVGSVREEDDRERVEDPDGFVQVADDDFMAEKLHLLEHRLPELRIGRRPGSYCGLYTVNLSDVHPLVGPWGPEGFFVANGFSGHGFKTAPAIGAMLARLMTGVVLEGEDTQDDDWLSPHRAPIEIAARSVLA